MLVIVTLAQFDNGAAVVKAQYDTVLDLVVALGAKVERGVLTLTLRHIPSGQSRTFTLEAGDRQITTLPTGLRFGVDPETGEWSFTRGNIASELVWTDEAEAQP